MPTESLTAAEIRAVRVRIVGRVQGLGVRPAAARLAAKLGLAGIVENTADGVSIELEGAAGAIDRYLAEFADSLPPGATIDRMLVEPKQPRHCRGFHIAARGDEGAGAAAVPLDRIVCEPCLTEVRDPADRRRDYPFTSCTACGPRYSIVEAMPYDRPATTMRQFRICTSCGKEYRRPADRRFHAQTNACPRCGPHVWLVDESGRPVAGDDAVSAAAAALRDGRIVAVKGLGGYQLLVDATSADSVRRLRERKQRKTKPLAVMVASLAEAERWTLLNDAERRLLTDPAAPIVIVRRRSDAPFAVDIAPGFDSIGLMLPTTPLHALIIDRLGRPLVCTSGNREGEPLAFDEHRAERQLQGVADLWLHHDRLIARPIDDSVVRVVSGSPCFLRLARGYAPHVLPLPLGMFDSQLVALGGEQKSAVALWNGSQAVLGPHIGDLTNAAACERWVEQLQTLSSLYGVELSSAEFTHDRHPDYFSSRWAQQHQRRQTVQHHHAHIAAVMFEHELFDREVLGLAWDGTGYGDDGTVWGGECLRATCGGYRRAAWLRPFSLLGGEQAVREPWRTAVTLAHDALGPAFANRLAWPEVGPKRVSELIELAARPQLSPRTSSMGRLFDGVAALVLGIANADDDGRPAMLLEQACDRDAHGSYLLPCDAATGIIDWRPLVIAVIDDLHRGATQGAIAMRFHRAVADLAASLAAAHYELPLVTAGGVFQNCVLVDLLVERLGERREGWFRPLVIPPGDGGLAAGQLLVAAARSIRTKERN